MKKRGGRLKHFSYSLRVRINGEKTFFFGPGIADLLHRVEAGGSLQTAAESMGMSYSKAWRIVRHAEQELGFSLLERHIGGAGGGFSRLTAQGRDFLCRYDGFQKKINKAAEAIFATYFGDYPEME